MERRNRRRFSSPLAVALVSAAVLGTLPARAETAAAAPRIQTRVDALMTAAMASQGSWGHYLKRIGVGGRELNMVNADRQFEPASMIKVLLHLRGVHALDGEGGVLDASELHWNRGIAGSCPTGTSPTTASMSELLRLMMQKSDNRASLALLEWAGGFSAINGYAAAIGATSTSMNHVIGCAHGALNSPNRLTLRDAGLIYERASNGTLLSRAGFRTFRNLMAIAPPSRARAIVLGRRAGDGFEAVPGEAAHLGVPRWKAARFLERTRFAWKNGSYTLCNPGCRENRTIGGWVSVPFKTRAGHVYHKRYVFGGFAADTPTASAAALAADRALEVLRPVIRHALSTW